MYLLLRQITRSYFIGYRKVWYPIMKKNPKRLTAIAALIAIIGLLIAYVISAFTATPGETGNRFMALLFGIITIPLLAWILLFCIGRMQNKHTIAELFLEDKKTEKITEKENI